MCVLCGEFVMQVHWTDRQFDGKENDTVVVGDKQLRSRQRDRNHRVDLANQILQHYGLKIDDWHGSKYVLRDRKGSSEVVHDLGVLWPAAEKLLKQKLDPLDPYLINTLLRFHSKEGVVDGKGV
jgi:hypothetical protein